MQTIKQMTMQRTTSMTMITTARNPDKLMLSGSELPTRENQNMQRSGWKIPSGGSDVFDMWPRGKYSSAGKYVGMASGATGMPL
jgi:hypothetical protein